MLELFDYQRVHPVSWVYLSSLLMLALYFKFGRLWSVRNLDLIGLMLLAPGLLLATAGRLKLVSAEVGLELELWGYVWLFAASFLLMIRLLADSLMARRPLLEPNLTAGGLAFLGVSLFCFLMANVLTAEPRLPADVTWQQMFARFGPGLHPEIFLGVGAAKIVAIVAHLALLLGMLAIGAWHFENTRTGVAAATLLLMLPYTAARTAEVGDVLPAALIVWCIACYRLPPVAGMLLGGAAAIAYYPMYLLPLFISFYWRRGAIRFSLGVAGVLLVVIGWLAITADSFGQFVDQSRMTLGLRVPTLDEASLAGVWQFWPQSYRLPLLAIFLCLAFGLAIWPAQKNLGTLLSCSAAVMLATQFWHPTISGLAMAWFLPLAVLTMFRPNLEDRVAIAVVQKDLRTRRREATSAARQPRP